MPDYTIMIMSHNNHELLNDCLTRIHQYTDFSYDLIVVDDASDPAYEATGLLAGVTIVRMPKRSNCCNLRNVGMEMAKTEWVFWLDNDTMVGQGWYQPLVAAIADDVGLIGQPKDARLFRNPFLPLTQAECMVEHQFAMDYNHVNNEADFFTSYCILVRKAAYRPTYCYNMPTPCLDPETGAMVRANGYKVKIGSGELAVVHMGSQTPRLNGLNYHYYLSRNFTRFWKFWEPHATDLFQLYIPNNAVVHNHNAYEPGRTGTRGNIDDRDKDYEDIPEQYRYKEY